MTVIEIIRKIGSEFEGIEDTDLNWWIEFSAPFVSKKMFGKMYERALALFTCHQIKRMYVDGESSGLYDAYTTISNAAIRAGISSISEGGSSLSFSGQAGTGVAGTDESDLSQTMYGRQFLTLKKMVICPIVITR